MAKFLNTRKAVSEIDELIRNAGERLILISPYLKLSKDFRELLIYRNKSDKVTTIIFGKQELNPEEMRFLESLRFVILKYNESLHAKCYVNDYKMIITSLNLYEFSMANNKEMGVIIDKNDEADAQLFEEAYKEVDFIQQTSQRFEFGSSKIKNERERTSSTNNGYDRQSNKQASQPGFCVRTGVSIPFNPERPMCLEAFRIWSEFGNPEYPEKFCHFTGEPSNGETSFAYPILRKNWHKAKELMAVR